MNIGIITGSGFYDFEEISGKKDLIIETAEGAVSLAQSQFNRHNFFFIARHGKSHEFLPNMINYKANILALMQSGVNLIIATSVMGIINSSIPLGSLCFFKDLYFPDNRLPDGTMCTLYGTPGEKQRGHYIFGSPFSKSGNALALRAAADIGIPVIQGLVHAHSGGPRFNSRSEIAAFKKARCDTVSQTVGPEIVLAGEAEIGYVLLGFGIDYANGVKKKPTPVETLNKNMSASKKIFSRLIMKMIELCDDQKFFDDGFVYRFI